MSQVGPDGFFCFKNFINFISFCVISLSGNCSVSGSKESSYHIYKHFYCNRSQFANLKSTNERKISVKKKGSSKISNYCTANIVINISKINGSINGRYISTHFNHEIQYENIRRSQLEKFKIARLLIDGLTTKDVFDRLTKCVNPMKSLTMQEIINVKNQYKIGTQDFINIECDLRTDPNLSYDLALNNYCVQSSSENISKFEFEIQKEKMVQLLEFCEFQNNNELIKANQILKDAISQFEKLNFNLILRKNKFNQKQ